MKIVICGVTGMLGFEVAGFLSRKNSIALYGLSRGFKNSTLKIPCKFFNVDITDFHKTKDIILDIKPDLIINCAVLSNVDECETNHVLAESINWYAPKNLALICEQTSATFIHISTDYVFDGKKNTPYKENDITNPINFYGFTKLKAEEEIKSICKKYFILRTSWLYGKYGNNFVDFVVNSADQKKIIKTIVDQTGTPTYTNDATECISRLCELAFYGQVSEKDYGIYHLTNTGECTRYEQAKYIFDTLGIKYDLLKMVNADDLKRPAARPTYSAMDNSKIQNKFKVTLRSWQDATREYVLSGK